MAYGIVNVPGGAGQELETVKNMAQSVNAAIHATNLALGKTASTNGKNCIAIGTDSIAENNWGVALGYSANARTGSASALGPFTKATGSGSTAVGCGANATAKESTGVGYNAHAESNESTALGANTKANSERSTALGARANANDYNSIAIGPEATAKGPYSISIGYRANTNGNDNIAIGSGTNSRERGSIALGGSANATALNSIAIGSWSRADGAGSVALGHSAQTANSNSIQLGSASYLSSITAKVSITVTSDERDKADIEDLDNAMEFLRRVRAFRYKANPRDLYAKEIDPNKSEEEYTEDEKKQVEYQCKYGFVPYDKEAHAAGAKKGSRVRVGVSAQEVQRALVDVYNDIGYANLVNDNLFDLDPDTIPEDVESHLGVSYENFIPFLIQAVQELDRRTSILEGEPA